MTGARVAQDVDKLIVLAHADGWDVCVIASPNGRRFIDTDALAAKTGHPVRSEYKDPDSPDVLPPANGMIVAGIDQLSTRARRSTQAVQIGKPYANRQGFDRGRGLPPRHQSVRLTNHACSMVCGATINVRRTTA
ncbi:hypothetical protein ACFWF7_11280 [Nocardia sp. NPDC060256]|uniref:hypothetical protein n=1 Tax=unclassified Nocardia TaxID=2637762 RepID=UPI00364D1BB0